MREIEFRAFWRGRMHGVGQLCQPMNGKSLTVFSETYVNMGEVPLMQYTGIRDVAGHKIFEGDIVELVSFDPFETRLFEIVWDKGSFAFRNEDRHFAPIYSPEIDHGQVEIIGNIYENEEMLLRLWPGVEREPAANQNTG